MRESQLRAGVVASRNTGSLRASRTILHRYRREAHRCVFEAWLPLCKCRLWAWLRPTLAESLKTARGRVLRGFDDRMASDRCAGTPPIVFSDAAIWADRVGEGEMRALRLRSDRLPGCQGRVGRIGGCGGAGRARSLAIRSRSQSRFHRRILIRRITPRDQGGWKCAVRRFVETNDGWFDASCQIRQRPVHFVATLRPERGGNRAPE